MNPLDDEPDSSLARITCGNDSQMLPVNESGQAALQYSVTGVRKDTVQDVVKHSHKKHAIRLLANLLAA